MTSEKTRTSINNFSSELMIYIMMILAIFIMGTLHSGLFRDEEGLIEFANSIFNAKSYLFYTLHILSLTFLIGFFFVISNIFPSNFLKELCLKASLKIPSLIYLIGSSVSGVMFSVTTYLRLHDRELELVSLYYTITTIFAGTMFIVGYFIVRRMEKTLANK
ncbi:hypothetical protein ABXV22_19025 [Vibrio rotiferianus]|uniref:hypothetical protein n=1 Tax=Vibrio rotiferianus TaxID=190895 RepID=UPI0033934983